MPIGERYVRQGLILLIPLCLLMFLKAIFRQFFITDVIKQIQNKARKLCFGLYSVKHLTEITRLINLGNIQSWLEVSLSFEPGP